MILECSVGRNNRELLFASFHAANNLRIDLETVADTDEFVGDLGRNIKFHAMSHVKHLIHFAPRSARTLLNGLEQRRKREEVVFDDMAALTHEMEHLRLCASRAMHHAVDVLALRV